VKLVSDVGDESKHFVAVVASSAALPEEDQDMPALTTSSAKIDEDTKPPAYSSSELEAKTDIETIETSPSLSLIEFSLIGYPKDSVMLQAPVTLAALSSAISTKICGSGNNFGSIPQGVVNDEKRVPNNQQLDLWLPSYRLARDMHSNDKKVGLERLIAEEGRLVYVSRRNTQLDEKSDSRNKGFQVILFLHLTYLI
jgi:hypothetical protein